jgi:ubiquinone/menaquinone biosynthesis C-methylase UbiE
LEIEDWKSHFEQIYQSEADTYHRMISAEDAYGELARKLDGLADSATSIVDIGAGTGRLTIPLCREGKQVHAVDAAAAMLDVARQKLASCPGQWTVSTADARRLPIDNGWADAAIAGWVFGHFTEWHPESWPAELGIAVGEMDRVVKPGGIEVVVDTLGTAVEEPGAPNPALSEYHAYLEEIGFVPTVLRTDYRFGSVDESIELLDWFFGLGDWARNHNDPNVPEFTGWWQRTR